MANRIKSFFESIVYAGMKPGARSPQDPAAGKPGILERFLSAPAPSDPLYLTNQTFGQKARRVLMMAVPILIVVAIGLVALRIYGPKAAPPATEPTAAELAAKVLPNFNHKDFKLDGNPDLEVMEVHFDHTKGSQMLGNLLNKTDRVIHEATVVFDVTDVDGSQLGGITITETNLAPNSIRKFQQTIEQGTAAAAIVRDVRSQ